MITDKQTNFVYFSLSLRFRKKYRSFWENLKLLLKQNDIQYSFIKGARDIWCRDFMPVQVNDNKFVQFQYCPSYCLTPEYIHTITNPEETVILYDINPVKSKLVIDGGNIIKSRKTVILTDKVLKDNSRYDKDAIVSMLQKELEVQRVIFIPRLPGDMTGHADGMVRFVNETDLLVADYSFENEKWRKKMDSALANSGLNIIPFPAKYVDERNEDGDYTAKGVYINFLQVGKIIFVPAFGFREDEAAANAVHNIFKDCTVVPVFANEIAQDGGVLNCISWNIKRLQRLELDRCVKATVPNWTDQEEYVCARLPYNISEMCYEMVACKFISVWEENCPKVYGADFYKKKIFSDLYLSSESLREKVGVVIDLILEYLASIGQYGSEYFCAN